MKGHARGVPINGSQRDFKQTPKGIHDKRCLLPTPGSPAILVPPPQHLTYLYHHLLFNPFILFSIFNFCLLKRNIVHIRSICTQWVMYTQWRSHCVHAHERELCVCCICMCLCICMLMCKCRHTCAMGCVQRSKAAVDVHPPLPLV